MAKLRLDAPWFEALRCPESGSPLREFDDWLFAPESVESDHLYPVICSTPILMPDLDNYLVQEQLTIARCCAEFNEESEVTNWFFNRYGQMEPETPSPLDTQVWGEGYPGFWEAVPLPDFVVPLVETAPEDRLIKQMQGRRFGWGLDLGCGQGGVTQRMARQCGRVIGVESHFYLAEKANRLLGAPSIEVSVQVPGMGTAMRSLEKAPCHNALVVCGDALSPPITEGLFDWVHCGHLLDLVDEPEAVILALIDLMQPGATLSINTPWDLPEPSHFDSLLDVLATHFEMEFQEDGLPWLRYDHKRRFILHEDWLWVGRLRQ